MRVKIALSDRFLHVSWFYFKHGSFRLFCYSNFLFQRWANPILAVRPRPLGLSESYLPECSFQQIADTQRRSPSIQVSEIEIRPLLFQDAEQMSPLPVGYPSTHLVPFQFVHHDVLRQCQHKFTPAFHERLPSDTPHGILIESTRLGNEDVHLHEGLIGDEIERSAPPNRVPYRVFHDVVVTLESFDKRAHVSSTYRPTELLTRYAGFWRPRRPSCSYLVRKVRSPQKILRRENSSGVVVRSSSWTWGRSAPIPWYQGSSRV